MKSFLAKIQNFFNAACPEQEIEERFLQKLQDLQAHPEKYPHILRSDRKNSTSIPPVSLF